uniref:Carbonic anhydrase n=1 Tax=Hydroides elegans TaxID=216498 RepID=A0A191ZDM4_HYDEL|nr:carbonic anhydrase [Hydroides elegans]
MEAVYHRVGRCFDFDAWDVCTKVITEALVHGIEYAEDGHWGYTIFNGPATWSLVAPPNSGRRQSPIDIHPAEAVYDETLAGALTWSYTPENAQTVSNNGHSAVVSFDSAGSSLTGGPLADDEYHLAQFHLHWGLTDESGSEHRVDGRMYAAELHMVHFNSKYGSLPEAADKPDGLSVLGFFIEAGDEENAALKPVTDLLSQIKHKGDSVAIEGGFDPVSFMPADTSKYWTYLGSLTTPPLFESVTWFVFKNPIKASENQLESLRALMESAAGEPEHHNEFHGHIVENYRPPQPLSGRTVRASFQ